MPDGLEGDTRPAPDLPPSLTSPTADAGRRWLKVDVALLAVVGAGFAFRVFTLFTVARRNPNAGDPWYYHQQSRLLTANRGFSEPYTWCRADLVNATGGCKGGGKLIATAIHPPLFSMWFAISNLVGADSWFAHKVMACIAGSLTILFVGLIGRELAGRRAGLLAAGIAAAYPNLWVIDGIGMPEGLFCAMIAGSIWAAYHWRRTPTVGWAAATGVALGLATLTRGEAIFLVPALLVPLVLLRRGLSGRARVTHLGVMAGLALLLLVPWTVRNATRFHDTVLLSTNSAEVLVYANCDAAYHGRFAGFWVFGCQNDIRRTLPGGEPPGDESQRANFYRHIGFDYAKHHQSELPAVLAARVGRVWDVYRPFQNTELSKIEGRPRWISTLGLWCYWVLLPFAIGGVVVLHRRRVSLLPVAVQALGVTVTALYAYGVVRFRAPAEVAVVVLAGIGMDALMRRRRPVRPGAQEAWAAAVQTDRATDAVPAEGANA